MNRTRVHRASVARTVIRFAVLALCLNLFLPLLLRAECGASLFAEQIASPTERLQLGRVVRSRPLLATLSEAPSVVPRASLERSPQRAPSPDSSKQVWAVLRAVPCLPSFRIDPLIGDIDVTPSFLLPSAHGLISFALPPPAHF